MKGVYIYLGFCGYSGSIRSDHLPHAFMGPNDADEIRRCEVRSKYNGSLHVFTDYKRLCEWLIIDCESAGDLTKSAHVFSGGILNERLVPCV